jgi:hypothetical protein
VALGAGVVALVAAEAALRLAGERPGALAHARFEPRSQVHLVKGMVADDEGVLKYDAGIRDEIARLIAERAPQPVVDDRLRDYESSVRYLVASFARSEAQSDGDDPFVAMIDRIAATDEAERTPLERAYLSYARLPINRDGFRSIELADVEGSKGKVLLLGDSFTFGYSARPLTASFADRIAAAGYAVYNTGVPAVGPAQYEHLAAKYVPLLRPDVVVVSFYMANDVVFWESELEPFQYQQYPTDVGFFAADPRGEYLKSPQEAYEYALQSVRIPNQEQVFNRLCAATVVGTKLWAALANARVVERRAARFAAYDERNAGTGGGAPVSGRHIARIKETTEEHGGKFLLAVITDPLGTTGQGYTPAEVFQNLEYHVPEVGPEGYNPAPDAHFNNEGHRRYAEFLVRLMEAPRGAVR